jgi:hypothetical protein
MVQKRIMPIYAVWPVTLKSRPTHNKNFMILASSVHDIAKSRFSQSATCVAERRSKIIESAKRHNGTIWPSFHQKMKSLALWLQRYGPETKYTTSN